MEYKLKIDEETKPVQVEISGEKNIIASIEDAYYEVSYSLISNNRIHLIVNGKGMNAFVVDKPNGKSVLLNGVSYLIQDADTLKKKTFEKSDGKKLPREIVATIPCVVISVLVKKGDAVKKGQSVIVLSAMKMETTLNAPFNGIVHSVNASVGENVGPGRILIDIEKDEK